MRPTLSSTQAGTAGNPRRRLRWLARFFVALVVACVVVGSIGFTLGPERFWLLAQAQYLPYPLFLVPAVAALGVSLMLGPAWRVACVVGLALVATILMGFEFHLGDAGSERIRVMTYNIKGYLAKHHAGGFVLIAQEIALHDPDIIVLQDAGDLADFEEKSPGAMRAIFGGQSVHSSGEYVVASRYPLRECKVRELTFRERRHSHLRCVVEARGTEVDVMTAHFMTPRYALGAARKRPASANDEWDENLAERTLQAQAIADDVRASRRPVILAGDLNAPQSSLVVRALLATGLRDAFSSAGRGYGHTWGHSLRPGISFLRIDHILVGPEIGVARCFVGGGEASAHRPVIADLYLQRPSA